MRKLMALGFALVFLFSQEASSDDIQGYLSKILVKPSATAGKTVARFYFSSYVIDRYSCHANAGYVEATDDHPSMNAVLLQQIMSAAMTAYSTGSQFALDYAGNLGNPSDTVYPCSHATWGTISP